MQQYTIEVDEFDRGPNFIQLHADLTNEDINSLKTINGVMNIKHYMADWYIICVSPRANVHEVADQVEQHFS
jgi:hypothetical protein